MEQIKKEKIQETIIQTIDVVSYVSLFSLFEQIVALSEEEYVIEYPLFIEVKTVIQEDMLQLEDILGQAKRTKQLEQIVALEQKMSLCYQEMKALLAQLKCYCASCEEKIFFESKLEGNFQVPTFGQVEELYRDFLMGASEEELKEFAQCIPLQMTREYFYERLNQNLIEGFRRVDSEQFMEMMNYLYQVTTLEYSSMMQEYFVETFQFLRKNEAKNTRTSLHMMEQELDTGLEYVEDMEYALKTCRDLLEMLHYYIVLYSQPCSLEDFLTTVPEKDIYFTICDIIEIKEYVDMEHIATEIHDFIEQNETKLREHMEKVMIFTEEHDIQQFDSVMQQQLMLWNLMEQYFHMEEREIVWKTSDFAHCDTIEDILSCGIERIQAYFEEVPANIRKMTMQKVMYEVGLVPNQHEIMDRLHFAIENLIEKKEIIYVLMQLQYLIEPKQTTEYDTEDTEEDWLEEI